MPVDVATGLPELDLAPNAIVTVTLDDPGAIIEKMSVHGWQVIPAGEPAPPQTPLFVPALTTPVPLPEEA